MLFISLRPCASAIASATASATAAAAAATCHSGVVARLQPLARRAVASSSTVVFHQLQPQHHHHHQRWLCSTSPRWQRAANGIKMRTPGATEETLQQVVAGKAMRKALDGAAVTQLLQYCHSSSPPRRHEAARVLQAALKAGVATEAHYNAVVASRKTLGAAVALIRHMHKLGMPASRDTLLATVAVCHQAAGVAAGDVEKVFTNIKKFNTSYGEDPEVATAVLRLCSHLAAKLTVEHALDMAPLVANHSINSIHTVALTAIVALVSKARSKGTSAASVWTPHAIDGATAVLAVAKPEYAWQWLKARGLPVPKTTSSSKAGGRRSSRASGKQKHNKGVAWTWEANPHDVLGAAVDAPATEDTVLAAMLAVAVDSRLHTRFGTEYAMDIMARGVDKASPLALELLTTILCLQGDASSAITVFTEVMGGHQGLPQAPATTRALTVLLRALLVTPVQLPLDEVDFGAALTGTVLATARAAASPSGAWQPRHILPRELVEGVVDMLERCSGERDAFPLVAPTQETLQHVLRLVAATKMDAPRDPMAPLAHRAVQACGVKLQQEAFELLVELLVHSGNAQDAKQALAMVQQSSRDRRREFGKGEVYRYIPEGDDSTALRPTATTRSINALLRAVGHALEDALDAAGGKASDAVATEAARAMFLYELLPDLGLAPDAHTYTELFRLLSAAQQTRPLNEVYHMFVGSALQEAEQRSEARSAGPMGVLRKRGFGHRNMYGDGRSHRKLEPPVKHEDRPWPSQCGTARSFGIVIWHYAAMALHARVGADDEALHSHSRRGWSAVLDLVTTGLAANERCLAGIVTLCSLSHPPDMARLRWAVGELAPGATRRLPQSDEVVAAAAAASASATEESVDHELLVEAVEALGEAVAALSPEEAANVARDHKAILKLLRL